MNPGKASRLCQPHLPPTRSQRTHCTVPDTEGKKKRHAEGRSRARAVGSAHHEHRGASSAQALHRLSVQFREVQPTATSRPKVKTVS